MERWGVIALSYYVLLVLPIILTGSQVTGIKLPGIGALTGQNIAGAGSDAAVVDNLDGINVQSGRKRRHVDVRRKRKRTRRDLVTDSGQTEDDIEEWLEAHNEVRRLPASSDMKQMYWDNTLSLMAKDWASRCAAIHGQPDGYQHNFGTVGQNIYYIHPSIFPPIIEYVTFSWYNEVSYFNYDTLSCREGKVCGHYTQTVWSTSSRVGCARMFCPTLYDPNLSENATNAQLVICNYGPAGNVYGSNGIELPYLKGNPCTQCSSGQGWCNDGLCTEGCTEENDECECNMVCHNGGTLNSNCSCTCTENWIGVACDVPCKDQSTLCGANPGLPKALCPTHASIQRLCPAMCGFCTPLASNVSSTTTAAAETSTTRTTEATNTPTTDQPTTTTTTQSTTTATTTLPTTTVTQTLPTTSTLPTTTVTQTLPTTTTTTLPTTTLTQTLPTTTTTTLPTTTLTQTLPTTTSTLTTTTLTQTLPTTTTTTTLPTTTLTQTLPTSTTTTTTLPTTTLTQTLPTSTTTTKPTITTTSTTTTKPTTTTTTTTTVTQTIPTTRNTTTTTPATTTETEPTSKSTTTASTTRAVPTTASANPVREVTLGVLVRVRASRKSLRRWDRIWSILTPLVVKRVNAYCRRKVRTCCLQAKIDRTSDSGLTFTNASYITMAPGYPVYARRRHNAMVYVAGAPSNSLCRHSREASRQRRSAFELETEEIHIELSEDLLTAELEPEEVTAERNLEGCCNATLEGIFRIPINDVDKVHSSERPRSAEPRSGVSPVVLYVSLGIGVALLSVLLLLLGMYYRFTRGTIRGKCVSEQGQQPPLVSDNLTNFNRAPAFHKKWLQDA